MTKVKFNLQSKKTEASYIYLVFRFNKNRLLYCTPYKVSAKNWDDKKQRIKAKEPHANIINATLDKLAFRVEQHYNFCIYQGEEVTVEGLRAVCNETLNRKTIKQALGPLQWIEKYLELNPRHLAESTIKGHKNDLKKIIHFREIKKWEEVTPEYIGMLGNYLIDKGMNKNTAHKVLKTFRGWINAAIEEGVKVEKVKLKFSPIQTDFIYLTAEELKLIQGLKCLNVTEGIVRDRFLLGCYTGLRVSDYSKLTADHFQEKDGKVYIEYKTQKSNKEISVMIPVHPVVKEIFSRFSKMAKTTIADQVLNRYIKQIAFLAGIKKETVLVKNIKGKQVEVKKRKCDCISTHTARRTFITNALLSSVPENVVMAVTGIKSNSTLMKYNKMEKEKSADLVASSEFFK